MNRLKGFVAKIDTMSLDSTIQTELAALRNEIKTLTKLVRKIKNTQEDPDGEKAKKRSENNGFKPQTGNYT